MRLTLLESALLPLISKTTARRPLGEGIPFLLLSTPPPLAVAVVLKNGTKSPKIRHSPPRNSKKSSISLCFGLNRTCHSGEAPSNILMPKAIHVPQEQFMTAGQFMPVRAIHVQSTIHATQLQLMCQRYSSYPF